MVSALTGWGVKEGPCQAWASSTRAKQSQQEAGVQDGISAFQTSGVSQILADIALAPIDIDVPMLIYTRR